MVKKLNSPTKYIQIEYPTIKSWILHKALQNLKIHTRVIHAIYWWAPVQRPTMDWQMSQGKHSGDPAV